MDIEKGEDRERTKSEVEKVWKDEKDFLQFFVLTQTPSGKCDFETNNTDKKLE
jgi:hypothetical protein